MIHYVFGYGSLIDSESRARTATALGGCGSSGGAIPVRLWNWVRLWNVKGSNTYLGVQKSKADFESIESNRRSLKSCVGVLFPLPSSNESDEALVALDRRERAYTRHRVDLESIERIDHLLIEGKRSTNTKEQQKQMQAVYENYYENTFLAGDESSSGNSEDGKAYADVCVWIYVPKAHIAGMATTDNPILQSYVDVCLKGCLSISKAFAKEFVEGTYGWYPGQAPNQSNAPNDTILDDGDSSLSCWIDDRSNPIYVRANKEYSLKHAKELDAIFDPILLRRRSCQLWCTNDSSKMIKRFFLDKET